MALAVEAVRQGARTILGQDGADCGVADMHAAYTVERHRAQRALLETEERFPEMAKNIESVFSIRSAEEHRVLYVSPAYESVGPSFASLYQQPGSFFDAVHPADRERVLAKVLQSASLRRALEIEYRIVRPDGSIADSGPRIPIRSAPGETCTASRGPGGGAGCTEGRLGGCKAPHHRAGGRGIPHHRCPGRIVQEYPVFEKITCGAQ